MDTTTLHPAAARMQAQYEPRQAIRARVAAGETMTAIAKELGISHGRVWQIVNRTDIGNASEE